MEGRTETFLTKVLHDESGDGWRCTPLPPLKKKEANKPQNDSGADQGLKFDRRIRSLRGNEENAKRTKSIVWSGLGI